MGDRRPGLWQDDTISVVLDRIRRGWLERGWQAYAIALFGSGPLLDYAAACTPITTLPGRSSAFIRVL